MIDSAINMALTEDQKRKIEEEERFRSQLGSGVHHHVKQTHGVPAILSFFIPGLGQIIKGQAGKGISIFIGVVIGLAMFVVPGVLIWLWQIVDAYNS